MAGFLSGPTASASSGDYLIDVTTGEKGLPNSSVTAIAQTLDGYLWVGTYNGLARFDGERFTKFYPENTPELRQARIRRLVTAPDGTLWISAHDGSVTSYRDGHFSLEWAGEGVADSAATLVSTRSNLPAVRIAGMSCVRPAPARVNRWPKTPRG
jgi:ligand-binding sensor domain-containing protein